LAPSTPQKKKKKKKKNNSQNNKFFGRGGGGGGGGPVPELMPLRGIPEVLAIRRSYTKIKKNNRLYLISIFLRKKSFFKGQ
jgi:hypothetical protein